MENVGMSFTGHQWKVDPRFSVKKLGCASCEFASQLGENSASFGSNLRFWSLATTHPPKDLRSPPVCWSRSRNFLRLLNVKAKFIGENRYDTLESYERAFSFQTREAIGNKLLKTRLRAFSSAFMIWQLPRWIQELLPGWYFLVSISTGRCTFECCVTYFTTACFRVNKDHRTRCLR